MKVIITGTTGHVGKDGFRYSIYNAEVLEEEGIGFLEWFLDLPHPHKILIAGNHDDCLRGETIEGLPDNCHYLDCSGVTIHGVRFCGIPLFMEDAMDGSIENKYGNRLVF